MKIDDLYISNFKGLSEVHLPLQNQNSIIIGQNGAGKSSVLECLSILFSRLSARLTGNRAGSGRRAIQVRDIRIGSTEFNAKLRIEHNDEYYEWQLKQRRTKKTSIQNLNQLKELTATLLPEDNLLDKEFNIPIVVYYPTNRAVLDIPLRIRKKHYFDPLSAWEHSLTSGADFRVFFEWFRNQEDLENEVRVSDDPTYRDKQLEAVRQAIRSFLPGFSNLRVRRNPLRMVVSKQSEEIEISQLSDGEKCILAMAGDLARRLSIANPTLSTPLTGEGITMIDEVELHLHPHWQRNIINSFITTFPNIQFIFTTHSPQILGAANEVKTFVLENSNIGTVSEELKYVYGKDSNRLLEEEMNTSARAEQIQKDLDELFTLIEYHKMEKAIPLFEHLTHILGEDTPELIKANVIINRWRTKKHANDR